MEILGLAAVKRVAPRLRLVAARQAADLDNLQAILAHRYEVLARYLKAARRAATAELGRLRLDGLEDRLLRRFLGEGVALDALPAALQARLDALLARSPRLSLLVGLRAELEGLWSCSVGSREQSLWQLQQWIARAEASGIRQLEEFSLRLRRYAL